MVTDETISTTPVTASSGIRVRAGRIVIGVGMLLALAFVSLAAIGDINSGNKAGASAIQIIQLWTPYIFWAIVIVGAGIAGYILTRALDGR